MTGLINFMLSQTFVKYLDIQKVLNNINKFKLIKS